jgi:DNA-binding NtrC family response regulator
LVLVHSGRPRSVTLESGTVGRDHLAELGVVDDQMSRVHFTLSGGARPNLADAGSRNGTFVNGERLARPTPLAAGAVARAGRSLFVFVEDLAPFEASPIHVAEGEVRGPRLAELLRLARGYSTLAQLLVLGPSGSGKEHVARAFHAGLSPGAPFVALNCATIAPSIAERLLFGAKRGAFTGAERDAEGHVQAAHGGTLFLDELAELDLAVQAKLLRFLETRSYFPVGDTTPRTADVRVCFATLRDLTADVRGRRFREDLYHRVATPALRVPSLRERCYEIPFLIEQRCLGAGADVQPTVSFVEAALLREWPGNVRQLLRTVDASIVSARLSGRASLMAEDLPPEPSPTRTGPDASGAENTSEEPSDDDIRLALKVSGGNVSVAARALGIHRSRLRRWMEKEGRAKGT